MPNQRPSPEAILARIKEEEKSQAPGKLKIFFGAMPGVGKTHTMLEEGLEKMAEGIDVVAGIVESHGRKEIDAMLTKFEQIPRRDVHYHGCVLQEFNLEQALTRKPALILVDELAHTNLPNSSHVKRWQDIKELLNHGIDVYTALNVQHLESINDVIAQITGVVVRETVPDVILEEAHAVELIDLPPDDLLKRLQEGKVYAPEQAELATKNFFNKGNLIALRELALRITAERVNAQVLSYRESLAIQKTWPTTERVMVCIAPDTKSAKLVRVTRRMAARLQAKWMAVYVEPTRHSRLSDIERHNLASNFRLVERLGGETFTLNGPDIVEEVLNFARDNNVTKILVGKESRSRLQTFIFGGLIDELIRRSGDIDIYIVQGGYEKSPRLLPIISFRPTSTWQSYIISVLWVFLCTLFGLIFVRFFDLSVPNMIYLLGVIAISLRGKRGPAILTSILSGLAFNFFFVPPTFTVSLYHPKAILHFCIMLFISLIVSHLVIMAKRQTELARLRERRTAAMYALSRKLASARGVEKILKIAIQHIAEVFNSQTAALLPDESNGELAIRANHGVQFTLDVKEQSVAQWVYDLGQIAGLGTQTLPFAKAIYVPLLGAKSVLGVIRVSPADLSSISTSDQLHFLETFSHQTALAIEADYAAEK